MNSATVRRAEDKVLFINNETHLGLELQSWQDADHFAQCLRRVARLGGQLQVSKSTRVKREGENVLIEVRGQTFLLTPCAIALEFSNAIIGNARFIEEEEKANDITFDQALLIRSGALPGVGLTDNKDIQELAAQEAAWNKILRKAIRGGVKQQVQFGTPKISRGVK